jgi:hypothetical protein
MNKQELIDLLKHNQDRCVGTISFTTEQVIEWIERLEEQKPIKQEADLEKFENVVFSAIQQAVYDIDTNDLLDHSSADFSLSGNEINLDSIEFNTYDLTDHIQKYVKEAIEELKEEEEENN